MAWKKKAVTTTETISSVKSALRKLIRERERHKHELIETGAWLAIADKISRRKSLDDLQAFISRIEDDGVFDRENGTDAEQEAVWKALNDDSARKYAHTPVFSRKEDREGFEVLVDALEAHHQRQQQSYLMELGQMAIHDLAAFHEWLTGGAERPAPHHEWMCKHLMKLERADYRTLLLSLSPGLAKSTYATRSFTMWCFLRDNTSKILMSGYNQTFIESEGSKPVRAFVESQAPDAEDAERYSQIPLRCSLGLAEDSTSVDGWMLSNRVGKLYARGAGAGCAGIRASITVLDDVVASRAVARSKTEQVKLQKWIIADILSRRLPNNRMLIIGTRWTTNDPIGYVESLHTKDKDSVPGPVKIIKVAAQCRPEDILPANAVVDEDMREIGVAVIPGETDELGRRVGEWMWEKNIDGTPHYTEKEHYIPLRQSMDPLDWSALYMSTPIDLIGDMIGSSDIATFSSLPAREQWGKVTMSIDTAQKAGQRNDFTVIHVYVSWNMSRSGKDLPPIKMHDCVHAESMRTRLEDVVKRIKTLCLYFKVSEILIEDAGFGSSIIQGYYDKLYAPIKAVQTKNQSKEFRFDEAVPYLRSGIVRFYKNAPWLPGVLEQVVAFPNGKNDDHVDAISQFVRYGGVMRRVGGSKKMVLGG